MRVAKTIEDVAELLRDYNVEISLLEDNKIDFLFPKNEEEKKYKENQRIDNFSHIPKDDPIHFTRKTRFIVRSLVESPRFTRITTVADQLSRFKLHYNTQNNLRYGKIKTRKRANENLCIVFENMKYAEVFFRDLKNTKMFTSVK